MASLFFYLLGCTKATERKCLLLQAQLQIGNLSHLESSRILVTENAEAFSVH